MNYLTYIQPEDIAERLYRSKRHWFHGNPNISLHGNENEFGVLEFDFHDQIVKQRVFIRDREAILSAAKVAVINFGKICNKILESYD